MIDMTITGLQETQAAMNQALAALQPRGALGQAVQAATIGLHVYAVQITHVDIGALRASHRAQVDLSQQPRGTIFVDPSAVNPRTGKKTVDYGAIEERRGGSHAFYNRTINERGQTILNRSGLIIEKALPRGGR